MSEYSENIRHVAYENANNSYMYNSTLSENQGEHDDDESENPENAGSVWHVEGNADLITRYKSDMSITELADFNKRTETAIRAWLYLMGVYVKKRGRKQSL